MQNDEESQFTAGKRNDGLVWQINGKDVIAILPNNNTAVMTTWQTTDFDVMTEKLNLDSHSPLICPFSFDLPDVDPFPR